MNRYRRWLRLTKGKGAGLLGMAFLWLPPSAVESQEIRETEIIETDLYFVDRANLGRLLEEARSQLAAGRSEIALRSLEILVATAEEGGRELRPMLLDALSLQARALLEADRRERAIEVLERLLRSDPTAIVGDDSPRALKRLLAATRKRLIGRLTITSEPVGARVVVDQREIGRTPIVEAPVLLGTRFVELRRLGYETVREEVRLKRGVVSAQHFTLLHRDAMLLLISDTEGAEIRIDGRFVGHTATPTVSETEELVAVFNLPIDEYQPPPLFLWRPAEPGSHELTMVAPCRRPARRLIEVFEGTDTTNIVPLEPAYGRLRIDGSLDMTIVIDDGEPAPPPRIAEVCPGPHLVEVRAHGRRTRATVFVEADAESRWQARFRPVLALLGDEPELAQLVRPVEQFNVVVVDRPSADPSSLVQLDGSINQVRQAALTDALGADLLLWTRGRDDQRQLLLLAADSPRPDIWRHNSTSVPALIRALDTPLPLTERRLPVTIVESRLDDHPVIGVVHSAAAAGDIRPGDTLVYASDRPVATIADIDAAVSASELEEIELTVERPTGQRAVRLPLMTVPIDPEFRSLGVPPNVALARFRSRGTSGSSALQIARGEVAIGKALLELGAWPEAQIALDEVDDLALTAEEKARLLYYRGLAATRAGSLEAARAALRQAFRYPDARLGGTNGPPLSAVMRPLLERVETALEHLDR